MELLMKAKDFTEISGLDTPLSVIPPGEPVVQTHKGLVDKLSGWKVCKHLAYANTTHETTFSFSKLVYNTAGNT